MSSDREDIEENLEFGKQLFEKLPNEVRPGWAGRILSCFDRYITDIPKPVLDLYPIITNPNNWKNAHNQFTQIRTHLLQNRGVYPSNYLSLAELVAKVTYNASGEVGEFDDDSGHYIPSFALSLAAYMNDKKLKDEVEYAILLDY